MNSILHRLLLTFILCGSILTIPSCTPHYQPSLTRPHAPKQLQFHHEHDNCILSVNQFTASQVAHMFNGRGTSLVRTTHPIFPIEITITNHFDYPLILDPSHIDLNLVSADYAAQRMHYKGYTRAISATTLGLAITGATFLSAAYITIIGAALNIPGLIKAGYISLGISGIMGISTPFLSYSQIKTSHEINQGITHDVAQSSLASLVTIEPLHTVSFFIFVERSHYKRQFTIPLYSKDLDHSLLFYVTLPKRRWT